MPQVRPLSTKLTPVIRSGPSSTSKVAKSTPSVAPASTAQRSIPSFQAPTFASTARTARSIPPVAVKTRAPRPRKPFVKWDSSSAWDDEFSLPTRSLPPAPTAIPLTRLVPNPSTYRPTNRTPLLSTTGPLHRAVLPAQSSLKQPGSAVEKRVRFRGGVVRMVDRWMEPWVHVWDQGYLQNWYQ